MRRRRSGFLVGALGLALMTAGCDALSIHLTDDCEFMLACDHHDWLKQDGGPPSGCVPSETAGGVADTCGVFVATSGDNANAGAKEAPQKTLAAAISLAETSGTRRVYACAETFDEALEVAGSVTIYGGLDCANAWRWLGETKKTTLTAAEGTIPLTMHGGGSDTRVRIEDAHVQARSAGPTATAGTSSITAVAEDVSFALARSVLVAGDAAAGEAGVAYPTSALAGGEGNSGNAACSADTVVGARGHKNDCGTPDDDTDDSLGGSGGNGEPDTGGAGNRGTPVVLMNGGQGEDAAMCTAGTAGESGTEGTAGAGATGLGEISASGYVGVTASDGLRGTTAQGGARRRRRRWRQGQLRPQPVQGRLCGRRQRRLRRLGRLGRRGRQGRRRGRIEHRARQSQRNAELRCGDAEDGSRRRRR